MQRPIGESDIAVVGPNNELDFYWNTQGSTQWNRLPIAGAGSGYSRPAFVQRSIGESDVAVVGPSNSLEFYRNTQGSLQWNLIRIA